MNVGSTQRNISVDMDFLEFLGKIFIFLKQFYYIRLLGTLFVIGLTCWLIVIVIVIRLNLKRSLFKKPRFGMTKTVSKKVHSFHKLSSQRIEQLKIKSIKKRSETKMLWGVRAYQQWRSSRLNDSETLDIEIFDASLDCLATVKKQNLEHSLCIFIAEVKKVNDDEYPGKTLYQLAVSIQRYLNENGLKWKLVDGPDIESLRVVLNNVMKERALQI